MILLKHRDELILNMDSTELILLVHLLKGYKETIKFLEDEFQSPLMMEHLETFIHELTYYQRYAEAEEKYLQEQERIADGGTHSTP